MSLPERRLPDRLDDDAPRRSRTRGRRWRMPSFWPRLGRRGRWILGGIALLVALIVVASFLVDEPLRRYIEGQMNERLKGYTARIERLSFHPIGASLTLYNLVIVQDQHPDPPVLHVEQFRASVQWKALLFGRLVADFRVDHPTVYADREHLRREADDDTPVKDKGWQEAFEAIYPLKINRVRITEGAITYADDTRFEPLTLTHVDITAENIRNIRSKDRIYPSDVRVEAVVFKNGRLLIEGNADFLAEPHIGVKGVIELADIALDPFRQITNRVNVVVQGGTLSARGRVEYGPTIKVVDLEQAAIRNVRVDYIHTRKDAGVAQKATVKTEQVTKEAAARADMILRAYGKFDVVRGTFSLYTELRAKNGYVNGYVKPLFKDVKAFDPEQDRDKGFVRKLWERLVGGVSKTLKNVPRREVATKVDISGPLEDPQRGTLQAVIRLLQNAFVRAILPGFDSQVGESPRQARAK
jgi:hypothetical protein